MYGLEEYGLVTVLVPLLLELVYVQGWLNLVLRKVVWKLSEASADFFDSWLVYVQEDLGLLLRKVLEEWSERHVDYVVLWLPR